MKTLLKRTVIIGVAFEIVYLLVVNAALNIPLTQDLINWIRPDKFAVSWDRAWTWYPFRVHAEGVSANGQTPRQQWQFDSSAASASINLLPLVLRKVRVSGVEAVDVEFRLRPRPRQDKDFARIREYFPPIEGRPLETRPPTPAEIRKDRKLWDVRVEDIYASGSHKIWLYQVQATLNGEAWAAVSAQAPGGPVSVSNGRVEAELDSLILNGDREVSREGRIDGKFGMRPFVPSENKGIRSLAFLDIDATLSAETESLAFLNVYLGALRGMLVDGAGKLDGRIVTDQGKLRPGTDLKVSAHELTLDFLNYRVAGEGDIEIDVPENNPVTRVAIQFGSLNAIDSNDRTVFFTGEGLAVNATGSTGIVPRDGQWNGTGTLAVSVPSVKVPDLRAYQRFLPDRWAFSIHGGEGELQGSAELSASTLNARLSLTSENVEVGFKDLRFDTNLDLGLQVDSPSLGAGEFDVSGTYIKLHDAKLSNKSADADPWYAEVNIESGAVNLNLDEADEGVSGVRHLSQSLRETEFRSLLASADETLKLSGSISDLGWLNLLMKNPYALAISGSGALTADIVVSSGWLDKGTHLVVSPQELTVEVLDYEVRGDGSAGFRVTRGGEFPDLTLDVAVTGARFARKGDPQAFVEAVDLTVQAVGRGMSLEGRDGDVELHLRIPAAKIRDMSVYNQYLPENSPLQFLSGEASLVADILLEPDDADGTIRLVTDGLLSRIDDQEVAGELTAEIKLVGGIPENMDFDISGSTLLLDRVRVVGKEAEFDDEDWAARFKFTKARAVWRKPIRLDLETELEMTDSRPVVSIIANQRGRNGWLEKALTTEDVSGEVRLQMADDRIVIPYAFADSDNIDVGAKGVISKETHDGVFYVRYRKLHGLLKIKDGDRNLDVLKARKKFDEYEATGRVETSQ